MSYLYDDSPPNGPLRQGEILEDLREIRFKAIDVPAEITTDAIIASTEVHIHPRAIVLSPDCDLQWDYLARQGQANFDTKYMSYVLLCDLEDEAAMSEHRLQSTKLRKAIQQNGDERYHYIKLGRTSSDSELEEYYIDFKRMFTLPIEYVIHESDSGRIGRLGVLRPPWNQHLIHRFTYYLGRVGLPDDV